MFHSTDHPPKARLRILAADPDEDARGLYRQAFGVEGCDLIEACDGRDALVKALVRVPALVITELRLPGLDGFALCEILRRDRTTANVPIVIATADTRSSDLARAQEIADLVLPKPSSAEVLRTECARLLASATESSGVAATLLRTAGELRTRHRASAVAARRRFTTTTPPAPPPALTCPSCDRPLIYELSYVGGVNERHPEQWDYFICTTCGTFQYRHKTGKQRRLRADEEDWLRRFRATRDRPHDA